MGPALNREALLEGQKKHWSAMTPMGRSGRPNELNGLAVFLASSEISLRENEEEHRTPFTLRMNVEKRQLIEAR